MLSWRRRRVVNVLGVGAASTPRQPTPCRRRWCSEGFCWADLERRVPATAETRFDIGSVSKTLTVAGLVA